MIANEFTKKVIYIDKDFNEVSFGESTDISFFDKQEKVNADITCHTLTYKNVGSDTQIIPLFQTVTNGTPFFYMIPCVNYNGNEWGSCKEPKGLERDGEPWIFPSDRIGVPACSIAELDELSIGVFANNDSVSANSSASIFCRDGKTIQRVYFSHVEYPVTYLRKYVYGDPMIEFIPFKSGEEKTFICYTYSFEKQGEKFGYGGIFDFVSSDYAKAPLAKIDAQTSAEYNFEFVESLVEKTDNGYISNMGFLPNGEHRLGDENSQYMYRKSGKHEIGWCGQNITVAEMHIRKYIESEDKRYLEIGTGILDTWLSRQHPSGIISAMIDREFNDGEVIDSCNEGWLLWKLVWCCELLKKAGVDCVKYESACEKIAQYYLTYFEKGGFPQISNPRGEIVTKEGCAGTMLTLGFLVLYKYSREQRYFERAKEAFDFYYDNFLDNSIAGGGALDTYCVDKESAGPVLRSALLFYELTGDDEYLEKAKRVAYYLMSWTYYHDVPFPVGSDCERVGVRTTGGTSVSTAHHHLDVWGVYYVSDMVRLYELTGNEAFKKQAQMLWTFTLQYISDGTLTLHGLTRAKGAKNEAVLHCNWNWSADGVKGQLNDWLVAWVATFQLDVYYALKDSDFFDNL